MSPPIVDLPHQLTQGFAARFIRYKVARLVDRASIRRADSDDLEQELKLHLVRRFAKFDPAIAHWNTFVVTVVERYLLTFLLGCRRRRLRFVSLDEIAREDANPDGDSRAMALGQQELGCDLCDPMERIDLILDVHHILARLPEQAQQLCERLMSDSLAEVARQLQVPRTTLRSRIVMLRNGFTVAFENNRKKGSSPRRKSE